MPHCIVEYSKELAKHIAIKPLLKELKSCILASNLFSEDSIKIRAISYEEFILAEKYQHFLHVKIHILSGRTEQQKQKLAQDIQSFLQKQLIKLNTCFTTEICNTDKSYQKLQ